MNNLRKKKALGIAETVGNDKLQTADLLEKEGFTNEEIAEVMEALDNPAPPPPPPPASSPRTTNQAKGPNDALDLSGFKYKDENGEFSGDQFEKYVELVGDKSFMKLDRNRRPVPVNGQLKQGDMYDFQLFKVRPIRVERFPGMPDSPMDYIGIQIVNDQPLHTSRMPVNTVLEFNSQILNAHSVAGNGKYYLLKK